MPVNRLMLLAVAVGAGVAGFAGTINGGLLPGGLPDVVRLSGPDHRLRDGDPRRRREPTRASSPVQSSINVLLEVLRNPDHARWIFYVLILPFCS